MSLRHPYNTDPQSAKIADKPWAKMSALTNSMVSANSI